MDGQQICEVKLLLPWSRALGPTSHMLIGLGGRPIFPLMHLHLHFPIVLGATQKEALLRTSVHGSHTEWQEFAHLCVCVV